MTVEELAEELVEFWISALEERDWAGRLELMNRIHEQLYKDMEDERTYRQVSPLFVGAVVSRLGTPEVVSDAQAEIYAQSGDPEHRAAARLWSRHGYAAGGGQDSAAAERRQAARQLVDEPSLVWVDQRTVACRLVDLSAGGARVAAFGCALETGSVIKLAMPDGQVRSAVVVHANDASAGLRFAA